MLEEEEEEESKMAEKEGEEEDVKKRIVPELYFNLSFVSCMIGEEKDSSLHIFFSSFLSHFGFFF